MSGLAFCLSGIKENDMATGINQVIILGNLGADPILRHTQNGTPVCNFSVATNEGYIDSEGEFVERDPEWHHVVAWGRLGETCSDYLSKGRMVFVMGRLQTRSYEDQEGIERWRTELIANNVRFLSPPPRTRRDEGEVPLPDDPEDPQEPAPQRAARRKRVPAVKKPTRKVRKGTAASASTKRPRRRVRDETPY